MLRVAAVVAAAVAAAVGDTAEGVWLLSGIGVFVAVADGVWLLSGIGMFVAAVAAAVVCEQAAPVWGVSE